MNDQTNLTLHADRIRASLRVLRNVMKPVAFYETDSYFSEEWRPILETAIAALECIRKQQLAGQWVRPAIPVTESVSETS